MLQEKLCGAGYSVSTCFRYVITVASIVFPWRAQIPWVCTSLSPRTSGVWGFIDNRDTNRKGKWKWELAPIVWPIVGSVCQYWWVNMGWTEHIEGIFDMKSSMGTKVVFLWWWMMEGICGFPWWEFNDALGDSTYAIRNLNCIFVTMDLPWGTGKMHKMTTLPHLTLALFFLTRQIQICVHLMTSILLTE